MAGVFIDNLPSSTCQWPQSQDHVYKLFKVRKFIFGAETILWPANKNDTDIYQWFDGRFKTFYDGLFAYLDTVFQKLDIDEMTWYETTRNQRELTEKTEVMFCLLLKDLQEYLGRHADLDDGVKKAINKMEDQIIDWLCLLRTLLETDPTQICERSYEEMFRAFVDILGLSCRRGDFLSELKFNYQSKDGEQLSSVTSVPDLFICSRKGNAHGLAAAVVGVKKDTSFLKQESADDRQADQSSEESTCASLKSDYPNGNPRKLTRKEEDTCSVFLAQLLGDVIASVSSSQVKLASLPLIQVHARNIAMKSNIGFGVVGFKVYVVNFVCVRRGLVRNGPWRMHEIPAIRGMGTDMLISEPLHLFKREDRNKLLRLLYAMKEIDYLA